MPLRKKILYAGLSLFALGGILLTWYVVKRHSGDGEWAVSVEGNRILTEKDIQDVVTYLLRAAKDGVSADEIRDALLLNTRIATARVAVLPGQRIQIAITERTLEYLQNEGNGVAEKDGKGTTIVENASQIHRDFTPDKVIFYLTFGGESMTSPRSDIIRLWKDTQGKYAFLWQRLAEIEIQPLKDRTTDETGKPGIWRYRIYSAGIRSCVVYEGRFSEETLRRLWAVYAYLEAKLPRSLTLVDLQENSAIIREMKTNRSGTEGDT
ncbi:MAG TPA: FtsQ-type POTRA domain-containing protein [Turneriella sp.]|nr:FtsQ-type POTRA domain-containing protein [Turneriella sp.]